MSAFAESVQQKQEANNPYPDGTEAHGTFAVAWYTGYATGFVAKTVAGAAAAKFLKGTTTAQKLEDAVSTSKLGRIASSVSEAGKTAARRVKAKVGRTGGAAVAPLVRGTRSASGAVRVWRFERRVDGSLPEIPSSARRDVSRAFRRAGQDGVRAVNALETAAGRQELIRLPVGWMADWKRGFVDSFPSCTIFLEIATA